MWQCYQMARRTVFSFSVFCMSSSRMWNSMDIQVLSAMLYVSEYMRKRVKVCMTCFFVCLLMCVVHDEIENMAVKSICSCPFFLTVMIVLGTVSEVDISKNPGPASPLWSFSDRHREMVFYCALCHI